MEGVIKELVLDRGVAFIHAQDGREVFFHRTSVHQVDFERLREGCTFSLRLSAVREGCQSQMCD